MRDSTIRSMHENNAKREALILDQLEFLAIRQHAMELIQLESSHWHRILWIFKPKGYWASVDLLQRKMTENANKRRDEVKFASKIQVIH